MDKSISEKWEILHDSNISNSAIAPRVEEK